MNNRKFSAKQEKGIANKFGGKRISNSGATSFFKGDVDLGKILVEAKTCTKAQQSFKIQKDWLTKLDNERYSMRKDFGALAFQFEPDGENYFILNERAFKEFLGAVNEKEN